MTKDKIKEITENEFGSFVKEGIVLVDFFADWCMPCLMMAPVLEELNEKLGDKIKIGKIDIGESQTLAKKHNISSIPNFILFKNGQKADQFIGAIPIEDFEEKLKKHL